MTKISLDVWQKAQAYEKDWWDKALLTFKEENKQLDYADKMGISRDYYVSDYVFDLKGKSVLDVGGGMVSLLLKCINRGVCTVLDPIPMPEWVLKRYDLAGIDVNGCQAENNPYEDHEFDEVWIYNCLQHTQDPELILARAKQSGKLIRIFEWLTGGKVWNEGHPQVFTEQDLDRWLGGEGRVEVINTEFNIGKAYYGIFQTL